ncbi:MAG: alpha-amylase/4-alpha-glucanotransferase domain-containing protein [Desulfurococcaceae archaeon]
MPVNFAFVLHFHQPHGQLKWINERIFENSYKLLLSIMRDYSDLKFVVHISGPLLLYLEEHHPDWLNEMFKLGDIGTVEFIAGTISESILPLVPSWDRVKQITLYLERFEKLSGIRPRGFWLPERVWEPWLPEVLASAGIEYVLLDDAVLRKSGYSQDYSKYAWITEESGLPVKVFFIDEKLRYILPWEQPERVVEYMVQQGRDESVVLVWGSDAEKFGEWMDPGRSEWWLRRFLDTLRTESRVQTVHLSGYLREYGVKGYLYLDTGSYDKMLEWSGGFFRNFLRKYAESNNMHKKALWVRRKLERAYGDQGVYPLDYYMAYCNDAYWHGLFGGVYLAHLRQAIYESLIRVEVRAEELTDYFRGENVKRILVDFDYDGNLELLVETPSYNLYVKPSDGGTLFEFDVKVKGLEHNVQDTMTRYPEPYLEGFINPDWYRRTSWRVHVWGRETTIHDWMYNTPFKDMSDLALAKYSTVFTENSGIFRLRTIGGVYYYGSRAALLLVEKEVRLLDKGYETKYLVRNLGENAVVGKIGLEYHVAWKINRIREQKPWYTVDGEKFSVDEWFSGRGETVKLYSEPYPPITLESSRELELWVARLSSYARTEKGIREIPQGLGVMFLEDVDLKKGDTFEVVIKHVVEF